MDLYQLVAYLITLIVVSIGTAFLGPIVFVALVIAVLVLLTAWAFVNGERWRAERRRREARFQRTDEVFADPKTGQPIRVFVDPSTGERRYVPEG